MGWGWDLLFMGTWNWTPKLENLRKSWKYRSGSLEVPDLSWLIAIFQNIHLKPNMLASMIFMVMDTKNIGSDLASLQKTGCYIPWRQFSIIYGNMAQGFLERLELQIKLSTKAPGSQSHAQWIMSLMKSPWDSHTLHIGISYSYLVPCVCVRLVMSITEIFPWFPWCPLLKSTMVHDGPWSFQVWRVAWTKPGWCPHHCRAKGRLYPPWFRSAFPAHSPAPHFAPKVTIPQDWLLLLLWLY